MEVGLEGEAERCLRKALELHPGLHEAQKNLRTLIARHSRAASERERPDAAKLIAEGHFGEAETVLFEQVAENSNNVDAWHNLGIIAMHQHREREAIEHFERVVEIKPDEEFARKQLVRLKGGAGDIVGALRECAELARIPKEKITATLWRAQLLQSIGKTSQAILELQQLVHADPELDVVWFVLSEIYEREGMIDESLGAATKNLAILKRHGGLADNIKMTEERIARLRATR